MAKTLPIQIVKTRGFQDIFKKEAGGGDELPDWVNDHTIRVNSAVILHQLDCISVEIQRKKEQNDFIIPVLMTATLHERATAKSYRSSTRAIFDSAEKRNIIGMDSVRNLIVKIADNSDIDAIKGNIQGRPGHRISKDKKCGIASVVDFKKYEPTINVHELVGKVIKVKLADFLDSEINQRVEKNCRALCW